MADLPAESGSVAVGVVIEVLKAVLPVLGVSIKSGSTMVTLVKDGKPEVYDLPAMVPRRMLARLSIKYGVKQEYFYHPEMCCHGTPTKQ